MLNVTKLAKLSTRCYATEATAQSKLLLSLVSPYQVFFESSPVERVDITATAGDMGILAKHVPTIQQLKPGIATIIGGESKTQKLFLSGGFAVMNPDNTLNINALEVAKPSDLDKNKIKSFLADATKRRDGNGSAVEKALAAAEIEVYLAAEKAVVE